MSDKAVRHQDWCRFWDDSDFCTCCHTPATLMLPPNLMQLKAAAEAAIGKDWMSKESGVYLSHANPAAILALVGLVAHLHEALEEYSSKDAP